MGVLTESMGTVLTESVRTVPIDSLKGRIRQALKWKTFFAAALFLSAVLVRSTPAQETEKLIRIPGSIYSWDASSDIWYRENSEGSRSVVPAGVYSFYGGSLWNIGPGGSGVGGYVVDGDTWTYYLGYGDLAAGLAGKAGADGFLPDAAYHGAQWSGNDVFTAKGGYHSYNSGKYYFKRDGTILRNGTMKVGDRYYEFGPDGACVRSYTGNCWKQERLGYYVRVDGSGKIIRTAGFYQIDGETYFLCGNSGRRVQGWLNWRGGTYYFDEKTGAMLTGYQVIDGIPYYFTPETGKMVKGNIFINGKRYYFGYQNGQLVTGWITGGTNGNHKYYVNSDGSLKLGWNRIASENRTYYFEPTWGYALQGLRTINGQKYLFLESTCAVGRRWVTYKGDRYYCDPVTAVVTTGKATIDGKPYTFDETGKLIVRKPGAEGAQKRSICWNSSWPFAEYSRIHTGNAVLYTPAGGNGIVVCVNAGHGTEGGTSVRTLCHPDGTPKVTSGSTDTGAVYAIAASAGTTMLDGTAEGTVTLQLARILKEKLLNEGFSVLMIRETDDVQLDNVARAVMANQAADCHLALHYDSSDWNKGFYCSCVPEVSSYRRMEPVASHWQQHDALGRAILQGVRSTGTKIWNSGFLELDLTQTSYSTIPSVDLECGDRASDWSVRAQTILAEGIVRGVKTFFE